MLDKLLKIFKSKLKSLEILYVMEGVKPVSRILALPKDFDSIEEFCSRNSLYVETADFRIGLIDSDKDYSNKGKAVGLDVPGFNILYISRNRDDAKVAKGYEQKQDHVSLGLMLGYPKCCCDFFQNNYLEEIKRNNDYIVPISKNTEKIENPFYNNIFTTYFDHALISHFPHSFDCEESVKLAKKYLEVIEKHSEGIAKNYSNMLKCVVVYTPDSINILYGEFISKNVFQYSKVLTTKKDDFYYLFYNSKKVEIVNKNSFKLNQRTMRNDKYHIFNFCK